MDNGFDAHLAAYPRGREYTYLVELTGCPYTWSDGKGQWTSPLYGQTVIHGGLAVTDWTFDLVGDPLAPLDIGGGLTVTLHDEPSLRTRRFFAPAYDGGFSTRLTAAPASATWDVEDSTGFTDGDYAYIGLETVLIDGAPPSATTVTVSTSNFGCLPANHPMFQGDTDIVGPRLALSPSAHRGRSLSIWIAPLEDDGTVGSAYKVWAGRLASVEFDGSVIRLPCDNLLAGMTKDDFPRPQPTGHFGESTPTFFVTENDFFIYVKYYQEDSWTNATHDRYPLGQYDEALAFETLQAAGVTSGWFTAEQVAKFIADTVIYNGAGTAGFTELQNNLAITIEHTSEGRKAFTYNNDSHFGVSLLADRGIVFVVMATAGLGYSGLGGWSLRPGHSDTLVSFRSSGLFYSATTDQMEYYPDDPNRRLTIYGCYDGYEALDYIGYARIYNGDNFELISFSGEEAGAVSGRRRLTGVRRGVGGTKARAWGDDPDTADDEGGAGENKTRIEQVWMTDWGRSATVDSFLLPALVSTGELDANSDYDVLGYDMGLALHEDFVAHEEIADTIRSLGLDQPRSLWITEAKKGKEDFASFMQANGLHFVAKRFSPTWSKSFTRAGRPLFGISVASNDMPARGTYTHTLTNADRAGGTSVATDFNERLIVNSIRLTPYWFYNRSASETGGHVWAYAEESIADYGASKTLEIKPAALYAMLTAGGAVYTHSFDIYNGLATKIGLRWFGSYALGNYTLTLETPHTGWRYQVGDFVSITLTGVSGPDAEELAGVPGKVMEVKQRHGANPGATLVVRLGDSTISELAPCFRATSHTGGTVLYGPRLYSTSDQPAPFPGLVDTAGVAEYGVTDSHWFDHTEHGGNFKVWCWEVGDYAGGEERTVTAVTHTASGNSTLTLSSALSAGLQTAATNNLLVVTFAEYANASALSQKFAYIGSAAEPSLLNATDRAPKLV